MTWSLHLGDCLEYLRTLPDKSVDHVITDPPYEEEAHTKARRSLCDATQRAGARNAGKVRRIDAPLDIAFGPMTEDLRRDLGIEVARVVRRWAIVFCQIEAVGTWRAALAGLDWIRGGVWLKPNGTPQFTGDRPGQGFECVAIAHAAGRKRWNGGGRHAVWSCPLDHNAGGGGKAEHPTMKPRDLMLALIEDFTDPGDLVLDPFAGSGTTGVAALRRGRVFAGCEINPTYHALASARLEAEEAGTTLQAARTGQIPMFGKVGTK